MIEFHLYNAEHHPFTSVYFHKQVIFNIYIIEI